MTDDLVKRLRARSLAFADDLDADAADRIEKLEKALTVIAFMENVTTQSEQHGSDLWKFRNVAMRALK